MFIYLTTFLIIIILFIIAFMHWRTIYPTTCPPKALDRYNDRIANYNGCRQCKKSGMCWNGHRCFHCQHDVWKQTDCAENWGCNGGAPYLRSDCSRCWEL